MIGNEPLDLGGQTAFVTGAGQGAGRAIALAPASHNAGGVAVNDYYPERVEAMVAEIEAIGVPALAVPTDVGDYAAVSAAIKAPRITESGAQTHRADIAISISSRYRAKQ